ncbi:MAG TPA: hypothetical protein DDY04_03700 [Bacteroidales bacterium]|nr:hypothetical protein [Bacteroidales bacterium]
MPNNYNDNNASDFSHILELVSEQKFGEAINELKRITEQDKKNQKAQTLLEQLEKIVEYQNMDLFSSTNLNMDPWLE